MSYAIERCTKVKHASKAAAEGHILLLQRAGKATHRLHAYFCEQHDGWHAGHDNTRPVRRELEESKADWARPARLC